MTSAAGCWKVSPSGWRLTRFTVSDGATAVMVTAESSAWGGTISRFGPTSRKPPSGPIVAVLEASGSGEHRSNPVGNGGGGGGQPSRSAWGRAAGAVTLPGEGSE